MPDFRRAASSPQLAFHVLLGGESDVLATNLIEWMMSSDRALRVVIADNGLRGLRCPELHPDTDEDEFRRILEDLTGFLLGKPGIIPLSAAPDLTQAQGTPASATDPGKLVVLDDAELLEGEATIHAPMDPSVHEPQLPRMVAAVRRTLRDQHDGVLTVGHVRLVYGRFNGGALSTGTCHSAVITLNRVTPEKAVTLGSAAADFFGQSRFDLEVDAELSVYRSGP